MCVVWETVQKEWLAGWLARAAGRHATQPAIDRLPTRDSERASESPFTGLQIYIYGWPSVGEIAAEIAAGHGRVVHDVSRPGALSIKEARKKKEFQAL